MADILLLADQVQTMETHDITRHAMALTAMANLLQDKGERICQAWQRFTPRKLWAGLSLEEFRSRVCDSLKDSRSIHHYAERAELIVSVLNAIERDSESGRYCPLRATLLRPMAAEPGAPRLAA